MARLAIAFVLALMLVAVPGTGAAADTGSLLVTCWPGHEVFLDGEAVGVTVVAEDGRFLTGLTPGRHTVRVEREGFLPFEAEVEVAAGAIAELKVPELEPAAATLSVCCEPGFRVYLDGALVGLTTGELGTFSIEVSPGTHQVRIEKLGREPYAAEMELAAGREMQVHVGDSSRPLQPEGVEPAGKPVGMAEAPAVAATSGTTRQEALDALVEPERAPDPTDATRADAFADLEGVAAPRVVADVLFGYRARGGAIAAGGRVTVTRERGGPKSPVMVFWCKEEPQCGQKTSATFAPGVYRFRVSCRPPEGVASDAHDVFLDLQASSGHNYLVDVSWDGDGSTPCSAEIADVPASG